MMELPSGSVTFLFTDIEGSGRLWEQHPSAMGAAVARHDELLQELVVKNHGHVVKMRGDGLHAVFASVQDAVEAAVAGQRALQAEKWAGDIERLPVRIGVHSGSADLRDGDYFGPTVNRAARLQDAGHGGQILLSQASAGLLGDQLPPGVSLRSLGRYQIQDFPAAEQVYQVIVPELHDSFPPLRAAGGQRTNLPTPKTSFIGRDRELASLKYMLEEARLVTLTGPGGAGKTRLAIQVAGEVAGKYRDGVWLVELAPLGEESMVLPAIANVFSIQPDARRSLEVALADFLRDKKMLLILDNCEHLIEVCATTAGELLDGAADLSILASSREALGVAGESILRVPSLNVPAIGEETAATLMYFEAIQLFSERAHAVTHEFQITDDNAAAVVEICRRLDGIPLAIELATSRLRLFSPQQLAARLNDRFRLLTGGSRTATPRQQTLQALIDWSYELLSPEEQALFRRLSVFVGGWTFEAAEALGDGLDVLELLDQLVNKSLVQPEQTAAGTRFRYLETIRQYARERLFAAGEGETVRDLHFAYFARLVDGEIKKLDGPRRDEVRPRLKPEIDNFRLALEWALERDTVTALDMLFDVVSFMAQDIGWIDQHSAVGRKDILRWLSIASESLGAAGPDEKDRVRRARAIIHLIAGLAAMGSGAFDMTHQETAKAIAIAREMDDQSLLMVALGFFAIGANARQIYDQEAIEAAEECLALAQKLGSTYYKEASLNVLAGHEMQQGNIATALAYRAEAARGGGFMSAIAAFQNGIDLVTIEGDTTRALHYLQESQRLFVAIDNAMFVAFSTSEIAHIRRRSGDLDAAEAGYRESLSLFHWQGHTSAIAHELECLAFIARRRNMPKRAARLLGAAETLRARIEIPMRANEQAEYDQELVVLKDVLDPDVFQEAWFAGKAMDINQAVEYALASPSVLDDQAS